MDADRFGPLDFDHFHLEALPALLDARGPVFSRSDAAVLAPLAVALRDGRSYTYVPAGDTFGIEAGSAGARTVVELDYDDWWPFARELRSSFALFYADRLSVSRGNFGQFVRWEPPLRTAIDGQARYDIDDPPPVLGADGDPLDLTRSFTLDDPDAETARFLDRAGFVVLRGVLDRTEIEALRADVTAAVAAARPDDRRSWWTTVDGREVCHRVNYLNDRSARIAGLGDDARFQRIAALGGEGLADAKDRLDGNGVVLKVPGADGGLADLPFHRDCGMGGHPVKCPMLNVGIQLDTASAATGQLQMIAGSHLGTSRLPGPAEVGALPVVDLPADPGDVTVHFGHTLHAAPPPTGRGVTGRRALYLSFVPPVTFEMVGPGQGYNDVLFTRDGGRVRHVDQLG